MVWDATYVDWFASSNFIRSALHPGQVATNAEWRYRSKYQGILKNYKIQPVISKTTAVCRTDTPFLHKSGHIAGEHRHEPLAMVNGTAFHHHTFHHHTFNHHTFHHHTFRHHAYMLSQTREHYQQNTIDRAGMDNEEE